MKKKSISLILLSAFFLLLMPLSGCGQGSREIAFFKYSEADTFIAEMMAYMTARVPEDINFAVLDAGNSQSVQNQQIVELIEAGSDLLVINAVDRLASSAIVARSVADGVPVIFFNREPLEDALIGNDNVFYVGADPDSMGRMQADMVAELFTENFAGSSFDRNDDGIIQLVILKGEQGHQDAERRTDHSIARLFELGFEVEVLAIELADWNRQDAFEAMRSLYERYGDVIELVISNNDDMALGAIDYLLEAGVFKEGRAAHEQPFIIISVDGTEVGLEAIGRGLLYGTVNNDLRRQSDAILMLIDFILHDRDFDSFPFEITRDHYIYIDGDIITLANLADFIGG
ncbi:MAG: galactose ABC transporter substrate-binding protein [Oscillospiraceae bacterium]|nr:galactose ABC transporter substrate-binding protein [Oscillospiraceae bacterium]